MQSPSISQCSLVPFNIFADIDYIPNWAACIIGLQTGRRSSKVARHHECHDLSAMTEPYQASKQDASALCMCKNRGIASHRVLHYVRTANVPLQAARPFK